MRRVKLRLLLNHRGDYPKDCSFGEDCTQWLQARDHNRGKWMNANAGLFDVRDDNKLMVRITKCSSKMSIHDSSQSPLAHRKQDAMVYIQVEDVSSSSIPSDFFVRLISETDRARGECDLRDPRVPTPKSDRTSILVCKRSYELWITSCDSCDSSAYGMMPPNVLTNVTHRFVVRSEKKRKHDAASAKYDAASAKYDAVSADDLAKDSTIPFDNDVQAAPAIDDRKRILMEMIKLGVKPSTIGQKIEELQQVQAKWQAWRAHHCGIPPLLSSTPLSSTPLSSTPSSIASSSPTLSADLPDTNPYEHFPSLSDLDSAADDFVGPDAEMVSRRPRSASWGVLSELLRDDGMVGDGDLPIFGKSMEQGSDSRVVVKPTVKKSVSG